VSSSGAVRPELRLAPDAEAWIGVAGWSAVISGPLGLRGPDRLRYRAWAEPTGTPLTLPALGIAPRTTATNATSADGPATGGVRLARAVDAVRDADGRPVGPFERLDDAERPLVAGSLRGAPVVVAANGFDVDPFDPARPETVPLHFHTDGRWVWSESLAYFADRYGLAPEPALLRHVRERRYRWPTVGREVLDRAAALVSGRTSTA
jgi:hypothetical protein